MNMTRGRLWLMAMGFALATGACSDDVANGEIEPDVGGDDVGQIGDDAGESGDDAGETQPEDDAGEGGGEAAPLVWSPLQSSGTSAAGFHAVYFVDDQSGWVVGSADFDEGGSVIAHTSDGGENWEEQASPTEQPLSDVHFADANTGWAVGTTGVARTDDGGQSWHYESDIIDDGALQKLHFVDESTGWAVGDAIVHTDDGGHSWTVQASSQQLGHTVMAVHGIDAMTAVGAGSSGWIVRTTDGDEWLGIDNPMSGSSLATAMDFVDANTGWVATGAGAVVRTDDGGETWEDAGSVSGAILGISFVDADQGWAIQHSGNIHRTTDGGHTWELEQTIRQPDLEQTFGTGAMLEDIHMVDDQLGWVVGVPAPDSDHEAPIVRYQGTSGD